MAEMLNPDLCPECREDVGNDLHWAEASRRRSPGGEYDVVRMVAVAPCGHLLHDYDLEGVA